jgi:hypothetical protein
MKLQVIASSLVLASSVSAGPVWTEMGDAAKLPPGQLIPFTPVTLIIGGVNAMDALGGPDVADVYRIGVNGKTVVKTGPRIGPPLRGTIELGPPSGSTFDTILVLFDLSGRGIVANDDAFPGETTSRLVIPEAGTYLLAVAAKGVQPVSAGGPIFNIYVPKLQFSQVPPNGPGGSQPVIDWTGTPIDPEPRNYVMQLERDVPTLSEVGMVVLASGFMIGATVLLRRGIALA